MKTITAATLLFHITPALSSVVFLLSSETNGQGLSKSWVVDRWKCQNLGADIDKQASWAFVASGLANGCFLYEDVNCIGRNLYVEKNNSNILGPGPVNLTDYDFDDVASSFSCV
ncbi:hypothetical protein AA0113_g1863 [Alternaria arborescens]|uniref:Uncharacterized protein n=1 Tax=Alternaria arborescens TaxID=156630 RepID=A0A4Q4SML2_9PLEO|nr:hypothetical protein AA0111_g5079 [Alternaria arborescens]RYN33733.1 hypothetical protein AA0112_g5714 [Alternaria arborescens]RYO30834.1 hypothetical protein AA0111_g5079 [Alternaria arborescens]RYO71512.1 hypothetical protein AA0113_g1863 [Alternaria arborescens]